MISAIFAFVIANYIPVILTYVAGGALYATAKWTFLLVKLRRLILEDDKREQPRGREWIASDIFNKVEYPPLVSNHKGRLMGWATFWPINLVWTMFADVAKEAWNWLYNKFGAVLQSIASGILPK